MIGPSSGIYSDNLDKWYDRDAGETFGEYTLYRLTRKQ
jgi:hypothetical protein